MIEKIDLNAKELQILFTVLLDSLKFSKEFRVPYEDREKLVRRLVYEALEKIEQKDESSD